MTITSDAGLSGYLFDPDFFVDFEDEDDFYYGVSGKGKSGKGKSGARGITITYNIFSGKKKIQFCPSMPNETYCKAWEHREKE